jgi:fructose 1,6-bisphosphatase
VFTVGDDIDLLMSHREDEDAEVVDALDERFEVSPAAAEIGAAEADDD